MVLVILGVMGGIAAATLNSSPSSTLPTVPTTATAGGDHATTTTSATTITLEALKAACVANVGAVQTAVQEYGAEHLGASPPAGTAWATARSGGFLQSWPSSAYYAITWNGRTVVVRAQHGRVADGVAGCDAL